MSNITINDREASIFLTAPVPDLIPVPAVAKAWGDVIDAHGRQRDARRTVSAAIEDVRRAKEQAELAATDAQIETGKVPKGMRKAIRSAEDDLEDAKLGATAAHNALVHFATVYRATVEVHAAEWFKLAVKDAEDAVGAVTSHRRSIANANQRLAAALGVLGMLQRDDSVLAPTGAKAPVLVDEALGRLTDAIGEGVNAVQRHKSSEVSRG